MSATGTAGGVSAEAIGQYFQKPDGVATHYTIGKDGTIVQSVDEKDGAWGNGKPETNSDPCRPLQLLELSWLTRSITCLLHISRVVDSRAKSAGHLH